MLNEIITTIVGLALNLFVITSMLAMGMSLTVKQILEPLRNVRLVVLVLVGNFVLVPALAWLLTFDYTQHMALYPDVIPLLTALTARDIKTGVLSNFTLATLDRSLEVLGIAQWIDTACAATVIGAAKPDAAAYLTVAATLDVPPERCLFFDDEPACVRGAQQTGMRAWLVDRTGHNTDTTLPSVRGLDEVLGLCGVR